MGWLTQAELDPLDPVSFDEENALVEFFERHPRRPAQVQLMGIDRYGADLNISGARSRVAFDTPAPDAECLHAALEDCIARHANA